MRWPGLEPHWGYQDGEVPVYDDCIECGKILRVDRLDLVLEHEVDCDGETLTQREEAFHRLEHWRHKIVA